MFGGLFRSLGPLPCPACQNHLSPLCEQGQFPECVCGTVGCFIAAHVGVLLHTFASSFIQVPAELNAGQALGIEVLCTFQMVFTVFSVEDQRRRESPEPGNLAIGLAHTAGVLIGVRGADEIFPLEQV